MSAVTETGKLTVEVGAWEFHDLIADCAVFADRDPFRPNLCGVNLTFDSTAGITGIATDTHCLIESRIVAAEIDGAQTSWQRFVTLPQVALVKALFAGRSRRDKEKTPISVVCSDDGPSMHLTLGMSAVTIGAPCERYPDTSKLWPVNVDKGCNAAMLNPRFIGKIVRLSAFRRTPGMVAEFTMVDRLKPVLWTVPGAESVRGLIMPARGNY